MSIQNIIFSDVNSVNVSCTVSGAITGTCILNFKRLDNIVTMSIGDVFGTANNTTGLITVTPSIPIPTHYRPTTSQINRAVILINNSTEVIGQLTYSISFNTIGFQQLPLTNFNGPSGVNNESVSWPVPTL